MLMDCGTWLINGEGCDFSELKSLAREVLNTVIADTFPMLTIIIHSAKQSK